MTVLGSWQRETQGEDGGKVERTQTFTKNDVFEIQLSGILQLGEFTLHYVRLA